jgi:hypothetical protein
MIFQPSAPQVAILTVHLISAYDSEKDKVTTRARISAKTLRRISLRSVLREAFIQEWTDALGRLGWAAFPIGDHFALIQAKAITGWPRIASSRIDDVLWRVRRGDNPVFDELVVSNSEDEETDDE